MCKQFYLFAAKVVTDPLFEFLRRKPLSRFDNGTFAMDPLRLDPVHKGDS